MIDFNEIKIIKNVFYYFYYLTQKLKTKSFIADFGYYFTDPLKRWEKERYKRNNTDTYFCFYMNYSSPKHKLFKKMFKMELQYSSLHSDRLIEYLGLN